MADRTDYDLTQHEKTSGQDLKYFDQESGEHYVPYVVEPSLGADRVTLAFLIDAFDEDVVHLLFGFYSALYALPMIHGLLAEYFAWLRR